MTRRITTIYEGTTGIQSNDLIGRKLARDRGAAMGALIGDMQRELQALTNEAAAAATARTVLESVELLAQSTASLLTALAGKPEAGLAVSVPYLKLCGYVICGWLLAKSAGIASGKAEGTEREFYAAKIRTAAFYAAHILPIAAGLARVVMAGAASVNDTDAALI